MKIRSILAVILALFFVKESSAQAPGFYFGPRLAAGSCQLTGGAGFTTGVTLQVGVSANKQLTENLGVLFSPHVGMYNAQRLSGEGDGMNPNGSRKILVYRDKYNIYSVEFPLMAKLGVGFGHAHFSLYAGPSLGYIIGGTRSKKYDDPNENAERGYSGHSMDDLTRGMYSGVAGASAELKTPRGIVMIDFRVQQNFSPLGRLEGVYFSAGTRSVGIAWMFDATVQPKGPNTSSTMNYKRGSTY
ncbi:MAG: outer membrane beta-barrel protein [Planctomycetota bacterium]